jgi:diguanylate cyclase (GGDEF)-like protein
LGRAQNFSSLRFERALRAAAHNSSRGDLLRRLLLEWTGVLLGESQVPKLWDEIVKLHATLREKLGPPVSLQTALLHHFHTRLGLLREPRILAGRDLSTLRVNAITDPLTGLYNRRFLLDHLDREIGRAERVGGPVSVLMMDLSAFKAINDRLGHPVGDEVLVRTARAIRESLRIVDAGCRYGGDEFVVVLPNTDTLNTLMLAERIRRRVAAIRLPRRVGLTVDLNYGVATFPSDCRTRDVLIKLSDIRLYACKQQRSASFGHLRRYPRFSVEGVTLNLPDLGAGRTVEVKELSYGGLAFASSTKIKRGRLEGEIVQRFSPQSHAVAIRPMHFQTLRDGRMRVGCAYEH